MALTIAGTQRIYIVTMETFKQIIKEWPTLAEFATDIGVIPNHAKQMRTRDSIPPSYWKRVAAAAEVRRFPDITVETMANIAENKRRSEL